MIKIIIDGDKIEYWDYKELTIDLFKQIMVNCEYRSIENIKENATKLIEFIVQDVEPDKRFARKLKNSIYWINRAKEKEEAIASIYDLMLSTEGLGNLTGFGELKNKVPKQK